MKNIINFIRIFCPALFIVFAGCNDLLEEQPRGNLTPEFFETAEGVRGGILSVYSDLRYWYVNEGPAFTVIFSDEYTNGTQITNPPLNSYIGLNSGNNRITTLWDRAYPAINTANGVIELGPNSEGLSDEEKTQFIAEAKFLRGFWYFMLARTYGGVTLDLGSGPLAFNKNPSAAQTRASLEETYDAIIKDLIDASNDLPDARPQPGRVWKATALHYLGLAYLTRGQSDAAQANDIQDASSTFQQLIPNATSTTGNFGTALLDDYADVHREGNEFNEEVLFTANRNGDRNFNDMFSQGGQKANRSHFYFRPFYVNWPGMLRDTENGRPWIRFAPTDWLMETAFDNKDVDSRFEKSFQTVWFANREDGDASYPVWTQEDVDAGYTSPANLGQQKFFKGDTAVWVVPDNYEASQISRINSAGYTMVIRDLRDEVYNRTFYASLKKNDAKQRPVAGTETNPNIDSYRSYIIGRLADTYLLAAEAAHLSGNSGLAADYLNTVRRRAVWPNQPANARDITAGEVTIDFILDERTRELCGEMMRWFDLVRTGKLAERMEAFNRVTDVDGNDHIGTAPGAIQDFHYLRPIPQSQLDLVADPTSPDGRYPQNPGYGATN